MKSVYIILILTLLGCKNDSSKNSLLAIVVEKNFEIKYEEYFNGGKKTDLVNVQSITKSIVSMLIGIAIDKGVIENEKILISKYFTDIGEDKKLITIEHLLNHTSGLDWQGYLEHDELQNSENPVSYVLNKELTEEPGKIYNYNSGGTHLLSALLTKASGKSTLEFAQEHLFQPLGITQINWGKMKDGIYDGAGFSLEMIPKDLVKIGQLFLKETQTDGKTILSGAWREKMTKDNLKKDVKWGLRKSKHGYGWYSSMSNNEKVLYSMGYGGQFILIIPSKEMVIVSTHNHDSPNGIKQQVDFLRGHFLI